MELVNKIQQSLQLRTNKSCPRVVLIDYFLTKLDFLAGYLCDAAVIHYAMLLPLRLLLTVTIVIMLSLSWFISSLWLWLDCERFKLRSAMSVICLDWCRIISPGSFLVKSLSLLLWLIKSRLLDWHCWLICVDVIEVDERSWAGVWTAEGDDDNCVVELLLMLWPFLWAGFIRLLHEWVVCDAKAWLLLIIPCNSLNTLVVLSLLALGDKTVLLQCGKRISLSHCKSR